MGFVDNDGKGEDRHASGARHTVGHDGRQRTYDGQGEGGFREEGLDAGRQEQQRVGHGVPQGAQLPKRGSIAYGMPNILRGPPDVLVGIEVAAYPAEIGKEREPEPGDRMRCLWREPG